MHNIKKTFWQKIHIDPLFFLFIALLLGYSLYVLWSASGQNIDMMQKRAIQILLGFAAMIIFAQFSPRTYEKWAPSLYVTCIIVLFLVDIFGYTSKGAQRWLDLGILRFQPSEIAKIAVPLMVAKFIHRDGCPPPLKTTLQTLTIIGVPALLVAMQPDLGTAILIVMSGLFIIFLAGIDWRFILIALILIAAFLPIMWFFLMHDYQQERVLTLFNPERDPNGTGYHIIQSKTAIGSGGVWGKGWLKGTQSQLEFLPERHTDFIFSVIAEEFGFIGTVILLVLFLCLIIRGLFIASQAQTTFGRILAGGLILVFFVYAFINIGMVSGILPVVGVPLPLISYGGSSLVVLMASFGIMMSIHTHRYMLSKNI
ncbi:rod shape-determining protein RodA [Gilliamella sp. Choc4-2]|jgi:rod shape determining protein RodA|uniref:peptidoglycan glycosyltransferase MrdB n=1 Tax=unclassified Gilliamella TaxID=2685620 RepID=UPI0004DD4647|nr:peptidoglycan glycosyltransferase MrdB [Gilliamella apicola]KFA58507.1 Rod shape-determining protein RodA [Gilliamella apicola]OCG29371.1 rod shape-determining protein RodA [Gilliamella apicola]OCG46300.1 rod shape-determining protein RodA [Gilliamella apicola]OCG55682.1 rod shape-determining protein RodA [Gilliamella apicola]OCG62189.1 rod shape-determining protein RodA [Gilliamella apicola]